MMESPVAEDGVREISPVQWFDNRDAVAATKDYRPRIESSDEEETTSDPPSRKKPAKD